MYVFMIVDICPKGDDPLTPSTGYPSIVIHTKYLLQRTVDDPDVGTWYSQNGYFRVTFQNESLFIPIYQYQSYVDAQYVTAPLNNTDCTRLFQSNWKKVVKKVSCAATRTPTGFIYNITFLSFPQWPHENNIYQIRHDGSVDMTQLLCEPYLVSGLSNVDGVIDNSASCEIIDTTPVNATLPGTLLLFGTICFISWLFNLKS